MFSTSIAVILPVVHLLCLCESAKILSIFPMASPSHYILGNALMRGLAEAGHDVTMISPFTEKNPPKNGIWRDIVLTGFVEEHEEMWKKVGTFSKVETNSLFFPLAIPGISNLLSEKMLNHPNVQKLMKSGEQFDAIIVAQFGTEAMKALAKLFNAHQIIFSTVSTNSMFNHLAGNPSLPSFAPEIFASFPPRMSFFQRVENTIIKTLLTVSREIQLYPRQQELIKKYFKEPIDLNDLLYNVSLVLVNSHVSISSPQPRVPCIIDIGGFHIKPPKKLPDDLQSFLDNATEGVIYMSMGSNLKSKDLPVEKRNAILEAFRKIGKKVLWKWEDDVLPGQPPNVKLGKWLPQQDILAHPNVKVFITQGGLLSTIETLYHGVPIIAIPILGDQKLNAYSAEMAGYGIVLPFQELTDQKLYNLLQEILNNPRYREEAQLRSRIMSDRLVKPLDDAVYWVEYVIRHNGAKHLRVAYLDLMWYEYYLLDVFAFIFAVIVGIYILLSRIVTYIIRRTKKTKLKSN